MSLGDTWQPKNARKEKWDQKIRATKKKWRRKQEKEMVRTWRRDETGRPLTPHCHNEANCSGDAWCAMIIRFWTFRNGNDATTNWYCAYSTLSWRQSRAKRLREHWTGLCGVNRLVSPQRIGGNTSRLWKIIYTNAVSVPAPGPNAHIQCSNVVCNNRIDVPCLVLLLQYSIPCDNRTNNNNNIACVCVCAEST